VRLFHARLVLYALPLTIGAICVPAACASRGSAPPSARRSRGDRNVLTRELMVKDRFSNVYDAVQALRSQWLRPRGPESFLLPLVVWVYLDDNRLGTVETLRSIQPSLVTSVRFYDGPSATGRWGVGHGAGVIHVSTWATGALGFPGTKVVPADSGARPDSAAPRDTSRRRP
jgi:hypothetical protein